MDLRPFVLWNGNGSAGRNRRSLELMAFAVHTN